MIYQKSPAGTPFGVRRYLAPASAVDRSAPMIQGANTSNDLAEKVGGTAQGGLAAIRAFAKKIGLPNRIDDELHLLKKHMPYHDSHHVLNLAHKALCGGTCLQDIEQRRSDEFLSRFHRGRADS